MQTTTTRACVRVACRTATACRRYDDFDELLPPCDDASGEFAIFAARSFDMPFFFNASYCFSFLMLELLLGICSAFPITLLVVYATRTSTVRRARPTVAGSRAG
jgi:hypothetical protein